MLKRRSTEQDDMIVGTKESGPRAPNRKRRDPLVLYLRAVGVVFVLFLITYLSLPMFLNAGRLRPRLEATLGKTLGRDVRIGNMRFTVTLGSLVATDVTVSDDPSFGTVPLLHAQRVEFGIRRLGALFGGDLAMSSIDIENASFTLVRDSTEKWNFYSILAAAEASESPGPRVRLKGGILNLRTGDRDEPFVLRDVAAEFPHLSTSDLPFTLTAQVAGGGSLQLNGKMGPLTWDRGLPVAPMSLLVNAKKVSLAESNLTSSIAPALNGQISFDGTVESDGSNLQISGNLQAAALKLSRFGSPAREPLTLVFSLQHDLAAKAGSLSRCNVRLNKGSAGITGRYQRTQDKLVIKLDLSGHGVPVAPLTDILPSISLPLPSGSTLEGGVAFFDLLFEGGLDRPAISGSISIDNTRLNNFDFEGRLSSVSGLDLLHFKRDLEISQWTAKINSSAEQLVVESVEASLPELGTISGSGAISDDRLLDFRTTVLRTGDSDKRPIPLMIRGASSSPVFR